MVVNNVAQTGIRPHRFGQEGLATITLSQIQAVPEVACEVRVALDPNDADNRSSDRRRENTSHNSHVPTKAGALAWPQQVAGTSNLQ